MNELTEPQQRQLQSLPEQIVLVGAGVVGRAIAEAHLSAGLAVFLVDIDPQNLESAIAWLTSRCELNVGPHQPFWASGNYVRISPRTEAEVAFPTIEACKSGILIESIVEQLDFKREFLKWISSTLGNEFVILSNTSSLRLQELAASCLHPERFCGLHFFMPIKGRDLVEVVRTAEASDRTLSIVHALAARIGKQALVVRDSPALVVNRMLTPYINQGLSLLEMGADHSLIWKMSHNFVMPRSPLEMVDMIGSRTAFNAGRVAWQAFPHRVEPSPIIPGLIKKGLAGWASGSGFYDYDLTTDPPNPSITLNRTATEVIARYQRNSREWTAQEIEAALTIPMWIEACCILHERVTTELQDIELAMCGGLGFKSSYGFFGFFDALGSEHILQAIDLLGPMMKAMTVPERLRLELQRSASATEATQRSAGLI